MANVKIFLCGDVMIGRGVDQILPHPCDPRLYESAARSALEYVRLAERASGEIARPTSPAYIWGEALATLARERPDARLVNLETSLTRSEAHVAKGINYRASPENAECLAAGGVDCCALANNHVLDWGRAGLLETLATLDRLAIKRAGAGRDDAEAWAPAIIDLASKGRIIVLSCALASSGASDDWAATSGSPGVAILPDLTDRSAKRVADRLARVRRPGDVVIVSLHWGPNWGYEVPVEQRRFARRLIEMAAPSIVHGHSSHHAKGIEVWRDRLILYGCGDFINDYEGIGGWEEFRGDLAVMYFAEVDPATGALAALEMTPLQIRRLQLVRPSRDDVGWLRDALDRESRPFGARVETTPDDRLALRWRRET